MAAFFVAGAFSVPLGAQTAVLDELFAELQSADAVEVERIESRIWSEWSKSGSPAMDLLLQRGRKAMEEDDITVAIDHFSALIDHAPEFAEGYNARATAYYRADRYGQAMEDIARTLTLNPRHFGALAGLALILQELGYSEDALDAWREVLALNPNSEGASAAIEALEAQLEGTAL